MTLRHTILFFIFIATLTSCATYKLSTDSFLEQFTANQNKAVSGEYQKYAVVKYSSNNIDKIKCIDKSDKEVWLFPDKNTQIIFTKKDGSSIKGYFDTVILNGDTITSLESRIAGGRHITLLSSVDKIKITAEAPKTKPVE